MNCANPRQHSHLGADGQTPLKCHDVSVQHTNPTAQMYHQMDVQQRNSTETLPVGDSQLGEETSREARQQLMSEVGKQLKVLFNRLNGKNRNRLVPLGAVMYATTRIWDTFKGYNAQKPSKQNAGYTKAFEDLYSHLPESSKYMTYSEDEFKSTVSHIDKAMEELLKDPNSYKKGTEEYGRLLCYWQYLKSVDNSIKRAYSQKNMGSEDIGDDPNAQMVARSMRLARKRANAKVLQLKDAINNKVPNE